MILSMTDDDGDVKLKMMICFGSDFAAQPVRVLVRCRSTLDFSSRSFKCRVKSRFGSRAELGSASDLVVFRVMLGSVKDGQRKSTGQTPVNSGQLLVNRSTPGQHQSNINSGLVKLGQLRSNSVNTRRGKVYRREFFVLSFRWFIFLHGPSSNRMHLVNYFNFWHT
ncbi:hypothetical protein HanRHA438_Chr17g0797111 [Helianthus annuus]|nr:hypothetical protein HanRHA438_Chr17g0797111 [Helianthus annuus]